MKRFESLASESRKLTGTRRSNDQGIGRSTALHGQLLRLRFLPDSQTRGPDPRDAGVARAQR